MAQINVSLPDNLIEETRNHAKKTGRTFSGMVRVGLEQQLKLEGLE